MGTTLSSLWSISLISCSFISFILSLVFLSVHTSVNTLFYFFKHTGWNTLVRLIISLRENQPATHGMLLSQILEILGAIRLWLSLAKQSLIWDSYPDQNWSSKTISQIFLISPSCDSRPFHKDGWITNLNNIRAILISYFL